MSGTHGDGVGHNGRSALELAVGASWDPSTLWGLFPKTGVPVAGGRELAPRVRLHLLRWAPSPWRSSGRQVRGHFFPLTPGSLGDGRQSADLVCVPEGSPPSQLPGPMEEPASQELLILGLSCQARAGAGHHDRGTRCVQRPY